MTAQTPRAAGAALLALCAALTLTGCGGSDGDGRAAADPSVPAPGTPGTPDRPPHNVVPEDYTGRFRVTATVLESPDHGPQLCHTVAESLPPQCAGPDVVGWDWSRVRAQTENGTTWGEYRLVGTWDGKRFTPTEPPAAASSGAGAPEPRIEPSVPARRTADDLAGTQRRLHTDRPELLGSHADEEAGVVVATATVATREAQRVLDERYGAGSVVLVGWLEPLD
ncbi:hypothetical protein GCM10027168_61580 [Streptomyces capparidis]